MLVGVGYPTDKPRTEHEEVYNKDIVAVDRRTGDDDEKWKFPAFEKKIKIIKKNLLTILYCCGNIILYLERLL